MDNTILQQGRFTSTGTSVVIPIISGVDWMAVYNVTQAAASQTTAVGVKYYWQAGFAKGAKWTTFKSNAAAAANLEQYITSNGFTLVDTSIPTNGLYQATITAVSSAAIPVVTNTGNNGLSAGQTVRLYNVAGAQQLGAMDFTVGLNTLTTTSFDLSYMAQISAGTTGAFRIVDTNPMFYPARRFITGISSSGDTTLVVLSVTHGYQVGQAVRVVCPPQFGMKEINGLLGTILSVDASLNYIELDIDSSSFTAFAFPLSADAPFSSAEIVPVGENTAVALNENVNILSDATINTALIGMQLQGGANCPAGANNDVIYWVAGKSFSVDNN